METLGKVWAGRVYGTNTGNLYVEFATVSPELSGTLRFMDTSYGLAAYSVAGTFDGDLRLKGTPIEGSQAGGLGELTVEGSLTPEGFVRGKWQTSVGTAGVFELFPHDVARAPAADSKGVIVPERLYTKNIQLGAVRLFSNDVEELLSQIRQDFLTGRPVVTFNTASGEVTRFAEDFLLISGTLGRLNYFKVTIQEPDAYGINRVVVVELSAFGSNEVRVQGVQESWVIGKAQTLASVLGRHESALVTTYKKFGLNLNQIIFVAMLVVMPSIVGWVNRAVFATVVFALLTALLWLHARYIPNAAIEMGNARPTRLARILPTMWSWFLGVSGSIVAGLILYWLTRLR